MKPTLLIIAALTVFSLAPLLTHAETPGVKRLAVKVDEAARNAMQRYHAPGMALAITDRRKLLHLGLYGMRNKDSHEPVAADTLFGVGSIGKSFTAVAMLLLHDQGKLDLNAPVGKYIPWFKPNSTIPVTAHHLLTHTAGLPNMRMELTSRLYQTFWLNNAPIQFEPEKNFHYSSGGYDVASVQIERIAGQSYEDFLRTKVLEPLEMSHSEPAFRHAMRPRLAVSYEPLYDDRPAHPSYPLVEANFYEYGGGAGSPAATAGDLAAYLRMLINRGVGPHGRLLSEDSFRLWMHDSVKIGENVFYGYGVQVDHFPDRTTIRHGGAIQGFRSVMIGDLEDGLGVVALANGPATLDVAEFALNCARASLRGEELPDYPANTSPPDPAADLTEFEGEFTDPAGNKLILEVENGKLFLLENEQRLPLHQTGPDSFVCDQGAWALFPVRFTRSGKEVAELTNGPRWYVSAPYNGPRNVDPPREWQTYVGHYRVSSRHHINFRVIMRKGRLWFVTPDGSETPLVEQPDGLFRLGETPEWLRFDCVEEGQALRVNYSGSDFHRDFTP